MAYARVGKFQTLVRELIRTGRATRAGAERAARRYVTECGCRTVVLDQGTGGVEYIVCDRLVPPIHQRGAVRKTAKKGSR